VKRAPQRRVRVALLEERGPLGRLGDLPQFARHEHLGGLPLRAPHALGEASGMLPLTLAVSAAQFLVLMVSTKHVFLDPFFAALRKPLTLIASETRVRLLDGTQEVASDDAPR